VSVSSARKEGTIRKEEKMVHMMACRICSVTCSRIQVIRAPRVDPL
jgi:hypothetical protein